MSLAKYPTGVSGFDPLVQGGLPRGRVALLIGGPGSGKTLFALETLVRGVTRWGEPGLLVAFEESPDHVLANAMGFDWNLDRIEGKHIHFVDAQLPHSVLKGGEFDLLGLLAIVRKNADKVGAKRIVFDGIDVLLHLLRDPTAVRREVMRLKAFVNESGCSAILTAKADPRGGLGSDFEFLEFLCDCVIALEHRVVGKTAQRAVRVTKYRGSGHSANEVAFAITPSGMEVSSASGLEIQHQVSTERVSTGVERLDTMLGGGYFRATSVLISGAPGTAKTTLTAAYVAEACRRKERTLFVSFDEAADQLLRNMRSVGIDLAPYIKKGLLKCVSLRARSAGPELHTVEIEARARAHDAENLIIDPISALSKEGEAASAESAAVELLDFAKSRGMTFLVTTLLSNQGHTSESTPIGLSTLADSWIHLSYLEQGGERNRALSIVKSRGTSHSSQVRELLLSDEGITLSDVYTAGGEVLMGTLRYEREQEDDRERARAATDIARRRRELEAAQAEAELRLKLLQHDQEKYAAEMARLDEQRAREVERRAEALEGVLQRRGADEGQHQSKRGGERKDASVKSSRRRDGR